MKKKIKDLTLGEVVKYCHARTCNHSCPFDKGDYCLLNTLDSVDEKELDKEVLL